MIIDAVIHVLALILRAFLATISADIGLGPLYDSTIGFVVKMVEYLGSYHTILPLTMMGLSIGVLILALPLAVAARLFLFLYGLIRGSGN